MKEVALGDSHGKNFLKNPVNKTMKREFTMNIKHCLQPVLILASIFLSSSPVFSQIENLQRIEWKKVPIRVNLTVGKERLVHFPGSVSLGIPESITPFLRSQSINGTVYLLAHQPFETTRVVIRSNNSGPIYLLDISAKVSGNDTVPLQIIIPKQHSGIESDNSAKNPAIISSTPSYVALTRFVAQQLYAPKRLLKNVAGIVRISVSGEAVPLVRGGVVDAQPVAAWRAGSLYVTAVKLSNSSSKEAVTLDPRHLRGNWLTATFQHNRLLPAGDDADTTVVYLVSDQPFDIAF